MFYSSIKNAISLMSTDSEHRVYEKDALEFVTVAAEYCNLLENLDGYQRSQFISTVQKLLSLMYLKASQLDKVESIFDEPVEKLVTEEEWIAIKNKVSVLLGAFDLFVEVANTNTQLEDEETQVALSECFADIYQDLADFVELYRNGSVEIMNDALWECRENFQHYWGPRLLSIMKEFHTIIHSGKDLDSEEYQEREGHDFSNDNPYVW